jgi:hypothetical protein
MDHLDANIDIHAVLFFMTAAVTFSLLNYMWIFCMPHVLSGTYINESVNLWSKLPLDKYNG